MDWEPHDRHWIRLRGPWDVSWRDDAGGLVEKRRVRLPVSWQELIGCRGGTATFRRRFQQPSQLDTNERVCITVTNAHARVCCTLNNAPVSQLPQPLGTPDCWPAGACSSFDVTAHLQLANELMLEVTVDGTSSLLAGLHEPVLIEIVTVAPVAPAEGDATA